MNKKWCGFTLAAAAVWSASALTPQVTVPLTGQAPVIDGVIDPAEWADALEITGFQLSSNLGLAKEKTRLFVKYDKDYFYIGAVASARNVSILNEGPLYEACSELFIMAPGNENIYQWLLYSQDAAGLNFVDAEFGGIDHEPGPVRCKVAVNKDDWTVEAALPAASCDLAQIIPGRGWKGSFHRSFIHRNRDKADGRDPEFSGFALILGQFQKPLEFPEMILADKAVVPVRMAGLDEKSFEISAAPTAEMTVTVNGGKSEKIANRNGTFRYTYPAGTETLDILITDGTEVVFANHYYFPADPAAARAATREKQLTVKGLGIGVEDSFGRIFADLPYYSTRREVVLEAARNEFENFQLVFFTGRDEVKDIAVEVSALQDAAGNTIAPEAVTLYREGTAYAPAIGYPTVRGKGNYPDPLFPLPAAFSLKAGEVYPVWASVKVPMDAEPGDYAGSITVTAGGRNVAELPVKLEVYPITIPVKHSMKTAFSIWENALRTRFCREATPENAGKLLKLTDEYAMMLVEHRLTPIIYGTPSLLPEELTAGIVPEFVKQPDGSYRVEADVYDALNRKYIEAGATNFSIGPYLWHLNVEDDDYSVPAEWPAIWQAVNRHYVENGLAPYAFSYPIDEPGNGISAEVNAMIRSIHENAPDIKVLITGSNANYPSRLIEDIEYWVPASHWVNFRQKAEQQARGNEVWQYPCSGPWYPWPNYHLDTVSSAWRAMAWSTAKYDFDGILYWATAIFNAEDPFNNSAYGANGDGVLQYPAEDGSPLPSLRLKVICDGMEDYEYMVLLKNAVAEAKKQKRSPEAVAEAEELLKLDSVFRTMDDYSRSEDDYRNFRRRAAELIGRLGR